jgi:hypothetical protein
MKKASTWYLVAFAIFNVGLALMTSEVTAVWVGAYHRLGILVPNVTLFTLNFHWWPYLFAGVAVLLALFSMGSKWLSSHFYHFIIMLLVVECFILLMEQLIFALPLTQIMTLSA